MKGLHRSHSAEVPSPGSLTSPQTFCLLMMAVSPRLTSIESVMPSSHLIVCHPLLLLPPIPPSRGSGAGTLGVPLEGTRRVGGLLGVAGRLSGTMGSSGSSVYGILQARILEWVAMPASRGSSQPRDQTRVSCISKGFPAFPAGDSGSIPGLGRSP